MRTPKQTTLTMSAQIAAEHAAGPITSRRKRVVWLLIVVSTLVLLISAVTIWVKREVLDTNNFTASTTESMRHPKVQSALATFLVDQIYQNVDVKADLEKQLPKNLKGLAGPAAAALNDYGTRAATRLLATSAVIDLVQTASRVAHSQFLRIVDDNPAPDRRSICSFGRSCSSSRAGWAWRIRRPRDCRPMRASSWCSTSQRNDQHRSAEREARARSLPLPPARRGGVVRKRDLGGPRLAARGDPALGAGVLIVGLLLFVIRHVLQGVLLDALVGQRLARPAVSAAYLILTELLMAIAWTAVAVGTITVVLAFLAGPSPVAAHVPRVCGARSHAALWIAWSVDALAILLILIAAPIDDWNELVSRLVTFSGDHRPDRGDPPPSKRGAS